MLYENELGAFLRTASVDPTAAPPSDAAIVTYVSLGTAVVVIGNTAVADLAGTVTPGGTLAAGLPLTNEIDVFVGAAAFSVTVAAVVVPPFTSGESSVTLSNAMLKDVGCVAGELRISELAS